ncbi:MAG: hypothetical protein AB7U75_00650 [Hyphomicrobiaceae bacterium]
MLEGFGRFLGVAAIFAAGVLAAWTAWACHRAQQHDVRGSDALVWAGLAATFFLYSQVKLARGLGWLDGWGAWLRTLAKQQGFYADRRAFQIAATIAVMVLVIILLVNGLVWMWNVIERYRLAVGFAALAVGFGVVRFISLHEVDAWNAALPYARTIVELTAATGTSTIALLRLYQLGELARLWRLG